MANTITSGYIASMFTAYAVKSQKASGIEKKPTIDEQEYAANMEKRISKDESTVTKYKNRNPRQAAQVDKMVNAGKSVLKANGVEDVDTAAMSMKEYKEHIARMLDSIPFDSSRPYDEESIHVSDAGWEQMKNDPEYEAWVLGYNKVNRSVRNPFAAMGMGAGSSYCIENFGASIEEHRGYGFSKTYGGTAAGARSMFNAGSTGCFMTKRAPQADAYPSKDYDIRKQQEEAYKKRGKKKQDMEDILEYRALMTRYWQRRSQAKELFDAQNSEFSWDNRSYVNVPASSSLAIAAYQASIITGEGE